jgi:drug/metabolite transporter (DMT)-like permease
MRTAVPRTLAPAWAILWLGVLAASLSPILTRYALDADAIAISFWRCAGGAAVLAPFVFRKLDGVSRTEIRASTIAGLSLALHFGAWISSLALTAVAPAVLLVTTTPIFVAVATWVIFGERLAAVGWLGILLALAGSALVAGADLGGSSVSGNLLALLGGAAATGYVLGGQVARRTLGILQYSVIVYGIAALALFAACLVGRIPLWGYEPKTWAAIAALVFGPQVLGHTLINFTLAEIDATTVTVAVMIEPVIATALAFVLLDEVPSALIWPGGAIILAGIYLVSRVRTPPLVVANE